MTFFADTSCIAGRAGWLLPFINNLYLSICMTLREFFMCHISCEGQCYILNNSPACSFSEENSAVLFGFQAPQIFI